MDVNSYSRYTHNVPLLTPIQSAFAPPEDPRFPVRRLSYFDKSNSVIVTYYLCLLSVLILGEPHLDGAAHPLCVSAISGGGHRPHV